MRHLGLVCFSLFPLLGCDGASATPGTCTPDAALDSGTAAAMVDDAAWSTTATWNWAGESAQITAAPADGWRFSVVGQLTDGGDTVKAAADAGGFPITVTLGESGESGGFATVYPTDGDSYITANAAGGSLTITEVGEDLVGCFSFSAGTDGGDTVAIADGSVRAALLDL
ncbi:MAG: hypothetical protein Q8P18_32755 [Pseudomonadota bacterium]|nr:hypothetical protein [Pseudomonadota bacterium]